MSYFQIVPIAPVATGITIVSILRYMITNFPPCSVYTYAVNNFHCDDQNACSFGVALVFSVFSVKAVWQMLAESTVAVLLRMFASPPPPPKKNYMIQKHPAGPTQCRILRRRFFFFKYVSD